ncbi:MAG: peptide chain release factor 1 [Acidobacteriota bacterium]
MFARLDDIEARFEKLSRQLADPEIAADPARYARHARAYAEIQDLVSVYRQLRRTRRELDEARELEGSAEDAMASLARQEAESLEATCSRLEEQLRTMLVPDDPDDRKNAVMEIRAGTGGDEATLFAAEVFRMYSRYAERQGWRVDVTDLHPSSAGGIKEVVAMVEGGGVYARLQYESGVHRVQRVPETEASGRIHTSAVTVAVLPEAEAVDVKVDDRDLRIDRYCSSGPGGQSVNTTYSAIRITHLPTGLVVTCQDEKSQHKNREKALRVLRARLFDLKRREQHEAEASARRTQVGTGDRSEKIRTYNFPQNRVTDHRVGLTLHRLHDVLDGQLDGLIEPLMAHSQAEKLKASAGSSA